MTAAKSLNRYHQQKREVLELLNELQNATVKQKQAAVLQRLDINLSSSSLYRLEMNRDKIVQPSGYRQRVRGTFKSNPKIVFT